MEPRLLAGLSYFLMSPNHLLNISWYSSTSVSLLQCLQMTIVDCPRLTTSALLPQNMQIIWSAIDLVPQFSRAFEGDDLSWLEHHVIACCGVPSLTFALFIHAEFAKSADEHIFARLQGAFDDLQQEFGDFSCLALGVSVGFGDGVDEVGFGQCHGLVAPWYVDQWRIDLSGWFVKGNWGLHKALVPTEIISEK